MEINVGVYDNQFVYNVLTKQSVPLKSNGQEVTLFWSGGVDSTYMLCWLLVHGYSVHTIYCEVANNKSKVKRENWARDKIQEYLMDRHPTLCERWTHHSTALSIINVPTGGFRSCLAQAPLWLINTQFFGHNLPPTYIMAYVNGDDALHWIPAFNKIIEGYNMLLRKGEKPVEVIFPLASIKKSWFYESLEPLYGKMTWCEMPTLKPNCDCPACQRHKYELGEHDDAFRRRQRYHSADQQDQGSVPSPSRCGVCGEEREVLSNGPDTEACVSSS